MSKVHLWAPLTTPLDPWLNLIQNSVTAFESINSIELQPPDVHVRTSYFSIRQGEELLFSQERKRETNILLIVNNDLYGPTDICRILGPLIEAFDEAVLPRLIICDLVKVHKRNASPIIRAYKSLLYTPDIEENTVLIRDFSHHECFFNNDGVCNECLIRFNLALSQALTQTTFPLNRRMPIRFMDTYD
jgi:hypothetical protein